MTQQTYAGAAPLEFVAWEDGEAVYEVACACGRVVTLTAHAVGECDGCGRRYGVQPMAVVVDVQ
jgi:hypothetical protein